MDRQLLWNGIPQVALCTHFVSALRVPLVTVAGRPGDRFSSSAPQPAPGWICLLLLNVTIDMLLVRTQCPDPVCSPQCHAGNLLLEILTSSVGAAAVGAVTTFTSEKRDEEIERLQVPAPPVTIQTRIGLWCAACKISPQVPVLVP